MVLPILVMAVFGRSMYGGRGGGFLYVSLAAALSGALAGAVWSAVNHRYRKKTEEKRKREKKAEFRRYLSKMDEYLSECAADNRAFMMETYKSGEELASDPPAGHYRRLPGPEGFLLIRIGTGEIPFQMKVRLSDGVKQMFPDEEVLMAKSLVADYQTLSGAPVLADLSKEPFFGIVSDPSLPCGCGFLLQILLQLCIGIAPSRLRLILFFDEEDPFQERLYEAVKFLPHIFAEGGRMRLAAGNSGEALSILPYLRERRAAPHPEHDLFLILNGGLLSGESLFEEKLPESGGNKDSANESVIFFERARESLPPYCGCVVTLPEEGSRVGYLNLRKGGKEEEILTETVSFERAQKAFRALSGIAGDLPSFRGGIPAKVPFLELYGVPGIQELEVENRYRESRPDISLRAPVGISGGKEVVFLDLHEKFHGPHGLVAGTTGSGKSELLQCYLISLCISFSPEDVNFFLIDYKGGGTGNLIRELPHCAGVISNLSGSSINRALKAVSSENHRRQRILSDNGVSHIDAYTEARRHDPSLLPMPHLILIVDEFAELKKEEPEFMQQIISLAAVGRSLGIHLILATQKPAGVVDERIFSNSRFRLCLKVQGQQDSRDMLHRPDAAFLKNPGEACLQVGNDEIFRHFQTGYLKDPYTEGGKIREPALLLSRSGKRTGLGDTAFIRGAGDGEKKILLTALTEHLKSISAALGFPAARSLWMEELPDRIGIPYERTPAACGEERILLGLYDDPYRQEQGEVFYIPKEMGHLFIAGGPASGKTTALDTILPQLPGYFVLADLSQKGIFSRKESPKCLGALARSGGISVFWYHLKREFSRRKEYGTKEHETKDHEPFFVVIDNFAAFFRALSEEEKESLSEMVTEGISIRFYFIITGSAVSDLPAKIFAKIKTAVALEMNDRLLYGDVLRRYRTGVYPKPGTPGRFLYRRDDEVLEGQIAVLEEVPPRDSDTDECCRKTDGGVKMLTGEETGQGPERSSEGPERPSEGPERFPEIPEKPLPSHLEAFLGKEAEPGKDRKRKTRPMQLPLGWSLVSGRIRSIDISGGGTFLISALNAGDAPGYLKMLRKILGSREELCKEALFLEPGEPLPDPEGKRILLIPSLGDLLRRLSGSEGVTDPGVRIAEMIRSAIPGDPGGAFIIGAYDPRRDAELPVMPLFRIFAENGTGMHLGGNPMAQRILEFPDLSYTELGAPSGERCGHVRRSGSGKTLRIRIPDEKKEVTEDDYD